MNEDIRVKIDESEQKKLFSSFADEFSKNVQAAEFLKISKHSFSAYKTAKTRYVPLKVLEAVVSFLGSEMSGFLEKKTLKEIRRDNMNKATVVLKEKYGSSLKDILYNKSRGALGEKYGKDPYKIITRRGHISSEKKYGKDWRNVISNKGVGKLREKYGPNWSDVILSKGRAKLEGKYGKDWQKKLSDLGQISTNKKYIENFERRPLNSERIYKNRRNTQTEELIRGFLVKNELPFESNVLINGCEFDILVPDRNDPKYVIEISNLKPTTYGQRMKVIQLYNQKITFPQAQHIAILRTGHLSSKNGSKLHKITKSFFDKEDIVLFSIERITKNIGFLIDLMKKSRKINFQEKLSFPKRTTSNSRAGCITQSKMLNDDERVLHQLLLDVGASPLGAYILEVSEGHHMCFDNFELYRDQKIAYEINSSRGYNSLRSLSGKILLCKKFRPDVKFIVILTNNKISNNVTFRLLKEVSDQVILKRNFNTNKLTEVRENVVSQT